MIKIFRKEGFILNPKDEIVNNLLERIEENEGKCPCPNGSKDPHCPCTWYRENNVCRCGLYIKVNKDA